MRGRCAPVKRSVAATALRDAQMVLNRRGHDAFFAVFLLLRSSALMRARNNTIDAIFGNFSFILSIWTNFSAMA
jgi:hypothetical protein